MAIEVTVKSGFDSGPIPLSLLSSGKIISITLLCACLLARVFACMGPSNAKRLMAWRGCPDAAAAIRNRRAPDH
jgi:hypothetical protein